jgi:hypothetical protein
VAQVAQRGEGAVDDLAARVAGKRRHEGNPAGVMLVATGVKALGRRGRHALSRRLGDDLINTGTTLARGAGPPARGLDRLTPLPAE